MKLWIGISSVSSLVLQISVKKILLLNSQIQRSFFSELTEPNTQHRENFDDKIAHYTTCLQILYSNKFRRNFVWLSHLVLINAVSCFHEIYLVLPILLWKFHAKLAGLDVKHCTFERKLSNFKKNSLNEWLLAIY